jgi:sulfotransferase
MSPVGVIFNHMLSAISQKNEAAIFIEPFQRAQLLRGCFVNYYGVIAHECGAEVIFDTNRQWCAKLPALVKLFPDCRVICMVRNPAWIVDSVERLVQANPFELSGIFGFTAEGTVYSRAERLNKPDGMLGFAYQALKEAVWGPHADRLLLVRYETLVRQPMEALLCIYKLIGGEDFPAHTHDPEHIQQCPLAAEFDARLGTPGLHAVAPKVTVPDYKTVLPPDLFRRYEQDAFWEKEIPAKVI